MTYTKTLSEAAEPVPSVRCVDATARGRVASRQTVGRGKVRVLYQPILDLRSEACVGAEALTRFDGIDADRSTQAVIRDDERSGAIAAHGRWLHSRCAFDWWKVGPRGWRLSLNVSPVELNRVGYATHLLSWFPRGGVAIELTETSPVPLTAVAHRNLDELRDRDVALVLDDLGDGFNSVERMLALGCTQVKLSRRWTAGLGVDQRAERMLIDLLDRIQGAGRSVTLEGVETAAQLEWARELGCEQAQGYGIALPMSIADLRTWRPQRRESRRPARARNRPR